jgi:hypothetical protein
MCADLLGIFLKKGLKKLKFEKGVVVGKNLKNGCLPSGRRGAGDIPSNQRAGCSKTFLQAPPEGPFANKKVSYSRRGP